MLSENNLWRTNKLSIKLFMPKKKNQQNELSIVPVHFDYSYCYDSKASFFFPPLSPNQPNKMDLSNLLSG